MQTRRSCHGAVLMLASVHAAGGSHRKGPRLCMDRYSTHHSTHLTSIVACIFVIEIMDMHLRCL